MAMENIESLNSTLRVYNAETEIELIQVLEDDNGITPEDTILEQDRHDFLMRCMSECLSPREERVIRLRFGFDGEDPMTLEEIGDRHDVCRERIRQLEKKALEKLTKYLKRHNMKKEDL